MTQYQELLISKLERIERPIIAKETKTEARELGDRYLNLMISHIQGEYSEPKMDELFEWWSNTPDAHLGYAGLMYFRSWHKRVMLLIDEDEMPSAAMRAVELGAQYMIDLIDSRKEEILK